jgi:hypothetical protein
VYNLATNVIKFSFLLQYRRLFAGRRTMIVCQWALVFISIWTVIQALLIATACLPLAFIVPSMANKCLKAEPIWYFSSAMNIVTDFAIFLIPLPAVYHLRIIRKKQKALLLMIFCLGFL